MQITRRTALLGAAAATVSLFGLSSLGARAADDNLDILLQNLRDAIATRTDAFPYEIIQSVTTTTWNRLIIPKLIPTQADRGYMKDGFLTLRVGGEHVMARNRRLAVRHDYNMAFDGCIGCCNSRNWQHDASRCQREIERISNDYWNALAIECADELDQDLFCPMYNSATHYQSRLRFHSDRFLDSIPLIAGNMKLKNRWVLVSPSFAYVHFGPAAVEQSRLTPTTPIHYLGDLPVYINYFASDRNAVLIGHDGSQEHALLWSPHLLLNPSGIVIDPNTFEPVLAFHKRHGVWFDQTRAVNHFINVVAADHC